MKQKIRKSISIDAGAFIQIKNQLPMPSISEETNQGGFLLGTDQNTYQTYIQHAYCLTAEKGGSPVGFGILFPDQMVRQSELWGKRKNVHWSIDLAALENKRVCYFEQLAFLKGHRKMVLLTAFHLVAKAFEDGHEVLLTTTVREPILNLAAVPFIKAAGGKLVGNIDEVYPGIGQINSDIYTIERSDFYQKLKVLPYADFLINAPIDWG